MGETNHSDNNNAHSTMWSGGVPIAPARSQFVPQLNNPYSMYQPSATMHHQKQQQTSLAVTTAPEASASEQNLGFPVRLHYMLTDIHKEGTQTNIVSWQPHGRCFVVHDKKQFVDKILSLWFRQSKWASFQRQLNMYGFKRLSSGPDKGGYYHDMFVHNSPQMAQNIVRQKLKGTGPRKPAKPDEEPNFYSMPLPVPEASYAASTARGYADALAMQCGAGVADTTTIAASSTSAAQPPAPSSSITLRKSLGLPLLSATMAFPTARSCTTPADEVMKRDAFESYFAGAPVADEDEVSALEDPSLWRYLGGL